MPTIGGRRFGEMFERLSWAQAARFSPAWFRRGKSVHHFVPKTGPDWINWTARRSGRFIYVSTDSPTDDKGRHVDRVSAEGFRLCVLADDYPQLARTVGDDIFSLSWLKESVRPLYHAPIEELCDALCELSGLDRQEWRRRARFAHYEPGVGTVMRPTYPEALLSPATRTA